MDPKNIARVLGKLERTRSRQQTQRARSVSSSDAGAWMTNARAATRAEDHDGIGVVVKSEVVRSSRRGNAVTTTER